MIIMFGDVFGDGEASAVGTGGVSLIVAGVLVAAGAVMWWSGSRGLRDSQPTSAARRPRRPVVETPGWTSGWAWALTHATIATGVIAGAQWASLRPASALWVSVLVLGLPALLAGATVVRVLAVVKSAHVRWREHPSRRSCDATVTPPRTGGDQ